MNDLSFKELSEENYEQTMGESYEYEDDNSCFYEDKWKDAISILETFGRRIAYIEALFHVWFYIRHGYEFGDVLKSQNNVKVLKKKSPMSLRLIEIAIGRSLFIEFCKLFEGSDKCTVPFMRKCLGGNAKTICHSTVKIDQLKKLCEDLKSYLDGSKENTDKLKEIRNKFLAHSDLMFEEGINNLFEQNKVSLEIIYNDIMELKAFLDKSAQLIQPKGCSMGVVPVYKEVLDIKNLIKCYENV